MEFEWYIAVPVRCERSGKLGQTSRWKRQTMCPNWWFSIERSLRHVLYVMIWHDVSISCQFITSKYHGNVCPPSQEGKHSKAFFRGNGASSWYSLNMDRYDQYGPILPWSHWGGHRFPRPIVDVAWFCYLVGNIVPICAPCCPTICYFSCVLFQFKRLYVHMPIGISNPEASLWQFRYLPQHR